MKTPSKFLLYREAQSFGLDAAFVANCVLTHHRNPTRKLRGLVALLRQGRSVSIAPYDISQLWIDGRTAPFATLEAAGERKANAGNCLERVSE